MSKSGYKVNWPMRIASILLCLVMFTTYLSTGLFAKYTTSSSGGDEARVIKFGDIEIKETGNFKVNGNSNDYIMTPGMNLTKDINIKFSGSEAATYVFVVLDMSNSWSNADSVNHDDFAISDGTDMLVHFSLESDWKYVTQSGQKYVYCITLDPNTTLDKDVISNNGEIIVSDSITKTQMSLLDSYIKVKAYVVQVGQFESPNAAWTSLSTK